MKNEKLTAVTNKICELLKGSSLDPSRISTCCKREMISVDTCIREAEILVALNNANSYNEILSSGDIVYLGDHDITPTGVRWILGQPLSSQPTEVIEFLFNVLNCE